MPLPKGMDGVTSTVDWQVWPSLVPAILVAQSITNMQLSSRNALYIAMARLKTSWRTIIITSCCDMCLNTDQHGKAQSFLQIPSLQVCQCRDIKKIQFSLYSGIILNKTTVTSSCLSNKKRAQPPEALEVSFCNTLSIENKLPS